MGAVAVSNYIAYVNARNDLTGAVLRQLTGIRRTKAQQIESYFRAVRSHAVTLNEDRMLIDACEGFRSACRRLEGAEPPPAIAQAVAEYYRMQYLPQLARLMPGSDGVEKYLPGGRAPNYLQYWYIVRNPFPVKRRWELNDANDGSEFSRTHAKFHPSLRKIVRQFGYEDMLLVDDVTGRVIYSVEKNPELGTDLNEGPYRNSALAGVFRRCLNAKNADEAFLTDFEAYAPNSGHPALFLASPIFDGTRRVGVLAMELSITELNRVVSGNQGWEADGLGKTGDTGIVGPDYLMRSNLRGFIHDAAKHLDVMRGRGVSEAQIQRAAAFGTTVLQEELRFPAVKAALAGSEGTDKSIQGSEGQILLSYGPLHIPGLNWALASGMGGSEALEPVAEMRSKLRLWALAVLLLTALAALALTQAILRPVNALVSAARQASAGDLSVTVPVASKDEMGMLSQTFNTMVMSIREKTEEVAQKNKENEALLLNILPEPIAARLKGGESPIADNFAEVTVLFADIVGFTALSGRSAPQEVVELLNNLFTRFDNLAQRHGVEKIKTIGDAYMAVTGLPMENPDHARIMLDMALDMLDEARKHSRETGKEIRIRVGVNSGPVVAGVIGKSKFIYDLWGDTVNLASRMESNGVAGAVQVTRAVYERLKDKYEFEERGAIEVKGKGLIEAWLVRRVYEEFR